MTYNLELPQVRATKAQLTATNAIYDDGTLIIETDSSTYTTGDGVNAYLSIRGNTELSNDELTSAGDVYKAMRLADSRDESGGSTDNKFCAEVYQEEDVAPMFSSVIRQGPVESVDWSYDGVGIYSAIITPEPPSGTLMYWQGMDPYYEKSVRISYVSGNTFTLNTFSNGLASDDVLPEMPGFLVIEFP